MPGLRRAAPLLLVVLQAACVPAQWRGATAEWRECLQPDGQAAVEVQVVGSAVDPLRERCLETRATTTATLDGVPLTAVGLGGGDGFTLTGPGSEVVATGGECGAAACCRPLRFVSPARGRTWERAERRLVVTEDGTPIELKASPGWRTRLGAIALESPDGQRPLPRCAPSASDPGHAPR